MTAAYGHSGACGIPLILHRQTARLWGIPGDTCVSYDAPDDLADRLVNVRGDRAGVALRYHTLIDRKIEQNRVFLRQLSRDHPALSAGPR